MITNKYRLSFMFALVSLLFVTREAESQPQDALEKLKAQHKVTDISMGSNGVPTLLVGKLTPADAKGTPEEITFQFFEENKALYKMHFPAKELKVQRTSKDELNMTHIRLRQQYEGVEVYGGELITHFNSRGELQSVNGNFLTDINIPIAPSISQEVAEMVMMDDLHSNFGSVKPEVPERQLLVYPFEEKVHLVWNFNIILRTPTGRWEYFVDAHNGKIVYKANRMRYGREKSIIPDTLNKRHEGSGGGQLPDSEKRIFEKGKPSQIPDTLKKAIGGGIRSGQLPPSNQKLFEKETLFQKAEPSKEVSGGGVKSGQLPASEQRIFMKESPFPEVETLKKLTRESMAVSATIYDSWWTNRVDNDGDGCYAGAIATDRARLNWGSGFSWLYRFTGSL